MTGKAGSVKDAVGAEGTASGDGATVGGDDLGGGEDEGDVGGGGDGRDFARETIGEEIIVRVKVVNVGGGGEEEAAGGVPSLPEVGLVTVDAETGIGVGGEEVRG